MTSIQMMRGLSLCGRCAASRPQRPWLTCDDWAWVFYGAWLLGSLGEERRALSLTKGGV